MKNTFFSICLVLGMALFSSVFGQVTPITPSVADNASPSDTNIRMRSAELERIKREADAASYSAINKQAQTKFPQIKEDFEGIQISESAIVKTYTSDKKIDYALIEISANDINKRAKRLEENLFAEMVKKEEPKEGKTKKDEKEKTVRDLIVELNNAIGSFVSSPIFGNLKVVDSKVAVKTRDDLNLVKSLSEKLSAEAKKLK
jgi:hypothetical protein